MRNIIAIGALAALALLLVINVLPLITLAQPTNTPIVITNPLTADDLPTLLKTIFNKALLYITYVIPIIIIIGAFQMMFAAGNPEKFASGRNTIVYAIIGYVIVLMANGIIAIVQSLLSTTP